MEDNLIREKLCESRRETIGSVLSSSEKEIGRIDNETNSLFDKIDVINDTFNGDDKREGVFESIRNLGALEKDFKEIHTFILKVKKVLKVIKYASLTLIVIVILTLGGSAAGFRLPQMFKDKVTHITKEIFFVTEKIEAEEVRVKEIIDTYLKEKHSQNNNSNGQ